MTEVNNEYNAIAAELEALRARVTTLSDMRGIHIAFWGMISSSHETLGTSAAIWGSEAELIYALSSVATDSSLAESHIRKTVAFLDHCKAERTKATAPDSGAPTQ